jgi:hypothetical protein
MKVAASMAAILVVEDNEVYRQIIESEPAP